MHVYDIFGHAHHSQAEFFKALSRIIPIGHDVRAAVSKPWRGMLAEICWRTADGVVCGRCVHSTYLMRSHVSISGDMINLKPSSAATCSCAGFTQIRSHLSIRPATLWLSATRRYWSLNRSVCYLSNLGTCNVLLAC